MTYRRLETTDGYRYYREAGAGEPILLLHCSAGTSGAWMPIIGHLGPGFRALAPDLLGYGRNDPWRRGAALHPDDGSAWSRRCSTWRAGRSTSSAIPTGGRSR